MTTYRVTTETGSVYILDFTTRRWEKNNWDSGNLHLFATLDWPWDNVRFEKLMELPATERPEVGKAMFIWGGRFRDWWLTTPVVSVEVVDDKVE